MPAEPARRVDVRVLWIESHTPSHVLALLRVASCAEETAGEGK
jgi:hypothetical protein